MNTRSRFFKAAVRALEEEVSDARESAPLVRGIMALAPLQPSVTPLEAQTLCIVVWRFGPWSVTTRAHCSKTLARLVNAELARAEDLISERQVPARIQIQSLRVFVRRLRSMNQLEGLSLYIAADLFKLAPHGARLGTSSRS